MPRTQYTDEEIAQRAEEIYRCEIRDKLSPNDKGKFIVVDIESGDYEIDTDDRKAEDALRARRPDGVFFVLRAGYRSAYKFGGGRDEGSGLPG